MSDMYSKALEYVDKGLLSFKQDIHGKGYQVFCYTKSCFFGDNTWDEVTKTHRGTLYHNKVPVNKPFDKIFNLDEVEETQLPQVLKMMHTRPYEIYDKANGHLFIVSYFTDDDGELHCVFSTKGSLPNKDNELLNKDIQIFMKYAEKMDILIQNIPELQNSTFMFEAVVNHDKHTMWDKQVEQYGEDVFVLLGVNVKEEDEWREMYHSSMTSIAKAVGFPVIHKYDVIESPIWEWKEHSDVEGYVIMFPETESGDPVFRVKVKTKEYWALRFKKDLSAEKITRLFKSGGKQRLRNRLPEEVVDNVLPIIHSKFQEWYYDQLIGLDLPQIKSYCRKEIRELVIDNSLSKQQFNFLLRVKKGESAAPNLDSKELRKKFYSFLEETSFASIKEEINKVVDMM